MSEWAMLAMCLLQTDGQELPGRLYKRPAGREREGAFWNARKHNACNVIGLRLTYSMTYDDEKKGARSFVGLRLGCENEMPVKRGDKRQGLRGR